MMPLVTFDEARKELSPAVNLLESAPAGAHALSGASVLYFFGSVGWQCGTVRWLACKGRRWHGGEHIVKPELAPQLGGIGELFGVKQLTQLERLR
jgi:hypothetical protein